MVKAIHGRRRGRRAGGATAREAGRAGPHRGAPDLRRHRAVQRRPPFRRRAPRRPLPPRRRGDAARPGPARGRTVPPRARGDRLLGDPAGPGRREAAHPRAGPPGHEREREPGPGHARRAPAARPTARAPQAGAAGRPPPARPAALSPSLWLGLVVVDRLEAELDPARTHRAVVAALAPYPR